MISPLKRLRRVPTIDRAISPLIRLVRSARFKGSAAYWDSRYSKGGNSGAGSYGRLAELKARVINNFVANNHIQSVIEFGCGDGNQLQLANYDNYVGFDVSPRAVELCRTKFHNYPQFRFALTPTYAGDVADLTISLDVIYHLVEDKVFHDYMKTLFDASSRFVLIYSCDTEMPQIDAPHVKTRQFSNWIKEYRKDWALINHIPNEFPYDPKKPEETSFADFYIYKRQELPLL